MNLSVALRVSIVLLLSACAGSVDENTPATSIRALLITGGCCHDYEFQAQSLIEYTSQHLNIDWTVVNAGGTTTRAIIDLYDDDSWASGFDVVIHNECFADTDDANYIRSITAAHREGVPAVVIHCAMHSYRYASIDNWREFLGISSFDHERPDNYLVTSSDTSNPVMKDFPTQGWITPIDELYVVEKLWPNSRVLATSTSKESGKQVPVIWTNTYGEARVFGTTFGHTNSAFTDVVFLNVLEQGIRWAAQSR